MNRINAGTALLLRGEEQFRKSNVPEPYSEAAVRHFDDAEVLAARDRFDGAGHLIGFAAECAVKYSVQALRPAATAPHLHFPDLIEKAKKILYGRRKHSMFTVLTQQAFMHGWDVSYRYSNNGSITRTNYEVWRADAARALGAAGLRRKAP